MKKRITKELPEDLIRSYILEYKKVKEIIEKIKNGEPVPEDFHTRQLKAERNINILFKQFIPLIYSKIKKYSSTRKDLRDTQDLYSVALIAFTKALDRFELDKNIKFITYLTGGLRNELIGSYRRQVKQSTVEACNTTEYFLYNDAKTNPVNNVNLEKEERENEPRKNSSYDYLEEKEGDLILSEFIRNIPEISIEESIIFLLKSGIFNYSYTDKEIKKYFDFSDDAFDSSKKRIYKEYKKNKNKINK